MDNRYRRDHEMPYYADESVIAEQIETKRSDQGVQYCHAF